MFFSGWMKTITKTQDMAPKISISAFACNLVQDTQCEMEIIIVRPKMIEEIYAITEA